MSRRQSKRLQDDSQLWINHPGLQDKRNFRKRAWNQISSPWLSLVPEIQNFFSVDGRPRSMFILDQWYFAFPNFPASRTFSQERDRSSWSLRKKSTISVRIICSTGDISLLPNRRIPCSVFINGIPHPGISPLPWVSSKSWLYREKTEKEWNQLCQHYLLYRRLRFVGRIHRQASRPCSLLVWWMIIHILQLNLLQNFRILGK